MNGGPFCLIPGTHKKKFEIHHQNGVFNWNDKYSWDEVDMEQIYGKENITYLTAKKGDLVIADTNCFHRGFKPISNDRGMITLDYITHIPSFSEHSYMSIEKKVYDELPEKHKILCNLLRQVDDPLDSLKPAGE